MRKLLLFVAVFCPIYVLTENSPIVEVEPVVGGLSGNAVTTFYWDCCKPACSWGHNAHGGGPVKSCAVDGVRPMRDPNAQTGCSGRSRNDAFACNDQQAWAVNDTLAYGFVAFSAGGGEDIDKCCKCYKLDFQAGGLKGKTMLVQNINTGAGLHSHFDIAIPGGGVGVNCACDIQWNSPHDGWGRRFGGIHQRQECDSLLPQQLRSGCHFRFDFLRGIMNPPVTFQEIRCPGELVQRTGCVQN